LYDASGTLVAKDFGKIVSYLTLPKGEYKLFYDNTTMTFKNK
jgi:hypothetical protein